MQVSVVVGPSVVADLDLLREVLAAELDLLGARGRLVPVGNAGQLREAIFEVGTDAVVALPGPAPDARALLAQPGAERVVWLDLGIIDPAPVPHIYGRGVWGLAWAVRHAVHRTRHPARRIAYGSDPEQWAELRRPARGEPPVPVAVLVHGGFWRSIWAADLMDALAVDLAAHGFAAWNLEYRRPDRHGWAATTADVAAGIAAVGKVAGLDPGGVAVVGHSAGGQLALRAAADGVPIALAVSLAGVLDLAEGHRRGMGIGAVAAALGGTPEQLPEVYAAADPYARLPLGVPQLLVQGRDDDLDLIEINRRYAAAARAAGDPVRHLEQPGDHFAVIDPGSEIWRAARSAMTDAVT